MFLIVAKYLIPKGYRGVTLFPFVLLKYREDLKDTILINHEKIHLRQQVELLIVPFFIWYLLEYIFRLFQYKSANLAYRNISFEREAYANEKNNQYLARRSFFRFIEYVVLHKK
ncbi:hypothetical protein [Flavobacterium sandaracinum]|uniref:DUF4157 domain-containing protein n=1 Tax=Flavobacterium sandaracinum TaxID=2541733 RepID=A0A4R5CPM1_9FLAO|nr:hypothetical protein [Flavobacterium sandaracinum]TDE02076.1 hypothetical protein E0F91_13390 [Flavobacterium sandaracinum]